SACAENPLAQHRLMCSSTSATPDTPRYVSYCPAKLAACPSSLTADDRTATRSASPLPARAETRAVSRSCAAPTASSSHDGSGCDSTSARARAASSASGSSDCPEAGPVNSRASSARAGAGSHPSSADAVTAYPSGTRQPSAASCPSRAIFGPTLAASDPRMSLRSTTVTVSATPQDHRQKIYGVPAALAATTP